MLTRDAYVDSVERDAHDFSALLRSGDVAGPVPSCPGWELLDLARHLSSVHRWATDCLVTSTDADETDAPTRRETLAVWFDDGAARLVDVLKATDPSTPTWNFGPPPRTAAFWSRRQAHETSVHLWDARLSQGLTSPIDGDLAADGVDEVVTMFFPRQVRLKRIPPLEQGLAIELTDADARYVLAGDGTDRAAAAVATVRGPSSDVLLALWGRAEIDRLDVVGDRRTVKAILRSGIVP